MVVTFKVDGKLVVLTTIYLAIGIAALFIAFPEISVWVPKNSSEMASWIQAIGALAIVWATYQLHYETKKKLDNELLERRNIEISKAKFFITQNSDIFMAIDVFINHIKSNEKLIKHDFVKFKSVEFFRDMFRHIEALNSADKKLTELISKNLVPDICIDTILKILLFTRRVNDTFSAMTSINDVHAYLSMIGSVYEINNDPIQAEKAKSLEIYTNPWVNVFINLKEELSKEKNTLIKLIFK